MYVVPCNIKILNLFIEELQLFWLGSLASEPLTTKHSQGREGGITETIIEQTAHCLFNRLVLKLDVTSLNLCSS
jgi:hypothetical protein